MTTAVSCYSFGINVTGQTKGSFELQAIKAKQPYMYLLWSFWFFLDLSRKFPHFSKALLHSFYSCSFIFQKVRACLKARQVFRSSSIQRQFIEPSLYLHTTLPSTQTECTAAKSGLARKGHCNSFQYLLRERFSLQPISRRCQALS